MKEQIKLFKTLSNISSINEKKEFLKSCENNTFFKEVLKFLLNPYINTGIREKKWDKIQPTNPHFRQVDVQLEFLDILNIFKYNSTGNNSTIELIKNITADWTEEEQEFVKAAIIRSLRLGVNHPIVNSVYGEGFIPTFGVQLGTPIESVKLKGNEWISITRKFNGTRCVFINGKLYTRSGKEYVGLEHIADELKQINDTLGQNLFFDGELLYKNEEGLGDSEAFQKGTGIANSKLENKTQLKFVIFDCFPVEEFYLGKSEMSYKERHNTYINPLNEFASENINVAQVLYQGTNHEAIAEYLNYAEDVDWEGIMLNLDVPYECKRVKGLIKVKKFKSCDVRCIRVETGTGRNKDRLGNIVVNYKGYEVSVGSGFSDEMRDTFWTNPEQIVGKIVSVKFKEETTNKQGGISIQFPVFESIRFDKDEESYN